MKRNAPAFLAAAIASTAAVGGAALPADAWAKGEADDLTYRNGDFSIRPRIDVRLRDEYRENLSLDPSVPQARDRERILLKAGVGADAAWKFLRLGLDVTDGRELIHDTESATSELDFTQLYLGLDSPGGVPLRAKVGRQVWNIGSRRLVSSSGWSNRKRSWDGLRVDADFGSASVTALAGSVVDLERDRMDRAGFKEVLWGAFMKARASETISVEVYVFGLYKDAYRTGGNPIRGESGAIGCENRVTPGVRVQGTIPGTGLDMELEGAFQVGSKADDSIHAFALAADLGWTMPLEASPRLAVSFDYASGDPDPKDGLAQTFVPLYGTTHSPYGIADLFRWQNMADLAPSLAFRLTPTLTLKLEQHTYWIAQTEDAWVNSSGKVLRQGDGGESNYAGQEWSLVAKWSPIPTVMIEGGISRFIGGTYMRDTGDRVGAAFGYASASFRY